MSYAQQLGVAYGLVIALATVPFTVQLCLGELFWLDLRKRQK